MNGNECIKLTQKLIEFKSTSYHELALARFIANWFEKNKIRSLTDMFNPNHFLHDGQFRPNTANVYVDIGKGPQTLLLYAHMDVVNAPEHMFHPSISNGRLFGRGAADMKSSLAALMLTAVICRQAIESSGKRVIFAFIADEETSGTGARRHTESLVEQNIQGNNLWCLLTEPTDGFRYIEIGGKGYIFIDLVGDLEAIVTTLQAILFSREKLVSAYPADDPRFGEALISITTIACDAEISTENKIVETGRSAHASRPSAGDNALEKMLRRLSGPVANIWTDKNSPNTIPNLCSAYLTNTFPKIQCRATIDVRTNLVSDENDGLLTDLLGLLEQKKEKIHYYLRDRGKAYLTPTNGAGLLQLCLRSTAPQPNVKIAEGGSDAGYYALLTPHVIGGFGPGRYTQLHTDAESIALSDVRSAPRIYEAIISMFLSQ